MREKVSKQVGGKKYSSAHSTYIIQIYTWARIYKYIVGCVSFYFGGTAAHSGIRSMAKDKQTNELCLFGLRCDRRIQLITHTDNPWQPWQLWLTAMPPPPPPKQIKLLARSFNLHAMDVAGQRGAARSPPPCSLLMNIRINLEWFFLADLSLVEKPSTSLLKIFTRLAINSKKIRNTVACLSLPPNPTHTATPRPCSLVFLCIFKCFPTIFLEGLRHLAVGVASCSYWLVAWAKKHFNKNKTRASRRDV